MAVWLKEYNPEQIANKIDESKIISGEGKVSFSTFEFQPNISLLERMLSFPKSFPEVEQARIVRQAVFKVAEKAKISAKNILREVNKLEKAYEKAPLHKYQVLTSISISRSVNLKQLSLNSCRISFPNSISRIQSNERQKILNKFKKTLKLDLPEFYREVKITVMGKSKQEATDRALDTLDVVRAVWNFYFNRTLISRKSSTPTQINEIVLGPVHTLHNMTGMLASESYWYQPEYRRPVKVNDFNNKSDRMCKFYKNIAKILRRHRYADELKLAIIRYVRALDLPDLEVSFIKLWGVLEQLTGSSFESGKVTVRRAAFLFEETEYHQQILHYLSQHRNKTVHFDAENRNIELYIYQLKGYVEALLEFHLWSKFGFESIENATEAMDVKKDADYLNSKIKLFQYVRKFSEQR